MVRMNFNLNSQFAVTLIISRFRASLRNRSHAKAGLEPATFRVVVDNPHSSAQRARDEQGRNALSIELLRRMLDSSILLLYYMLQNNVKGLV